ncbi:MAG: acetolactate decarboxylase [Saprospiraceae bacterium]
MENWPSPTQIPPSEFYYILAAIIFKPDQASDLEEKLNYEQLRNYLLTQLPDEEGFYAIRIEGNFQQVITRSVPQQEKPYPTLAEAIEQQVVFEYTQMEGTMVGIYMPQSAANEGIPGFHFHFISKDKTRGGHLLDCTSGRPAYPGSCT